MVTETPSREHTEKTQGARAPFRPMATAEEQSQPRKEHWGLEGRQSLPWHLWARMLLSQASEGSWLQEQTALPGLSQFSICMNSAVSSVLQRRFSQSS